MIKTLTATLALTALASFASAAEPMKMADTQLDTVVAGWTDCTCEKGNNGWGNGADPTNPGSFSGATAPSKSANGTNGPGINTNPTFSDGR
ncbi:MAG TPA: hypothetical protein VHK70_07025 [Burkholderiaceae bacterium]|jgi:hypothetical protein|nr:hypothetical protein [Burkholderiaceae bacterium]